MHGFYVGWLLVGPGACYLVFGAFLLPASFARSVWRLCCLLHGLAPLSLHGVAFACMVFT